MNSYEISLWQDMPDSKTNLKEEKLMVIGSDTMTSPCRALSPNLIEDINGTHTFTFTMEKGYIDSITGENIENPFIPYLFNERKVKVKWNNKWYDLVIKKCSEENTGKAISYTCTDIFINELSKNGYSIEFSTDLQNNIGTANELAKLVLDGSSWQYSDELSTPIIQKTTGPVYDTVINSNIVATKQSPNGDVEVTIPANSEILVFYDSIIDLLTLEENEVKQATIQFLYAGENVEFQTDVNETLVINGDCYETTYYFRIYIQDNKKYLMATKKNIPYNYFTINITDGISNIYTAERLVRSQITVFDPLLNRYVLLCKDDQNNDIYEIITTEYSNPVYITNLIVNPSKFINTQGWIGNVGSIDFIPKFEPPDENYAEYINNYKGEPYLSLNPGYTYNNGLQANISYFTPTENEIQSGIVGGIQKGEKYVFRYRCIKSTQNNESSQGQGSSSSGGNDGGDGWVIVVPGIPVVSAPRPQPSQIFNIFKYNVTDFTPIVNTEIFNNSSDSQYNTEDNQYTWTEVICTAKISVSAADLKEYGLFINNVTSSKIDILEFQFYKYTEGVTSYDEDAVIERIDPGEVSLQSLATQVYKYYKPNSARDEDDQLTDASQINFLDVSNIELFTKYVPQYNNYEKLGTIDVKQSNRFNLLQTIAETFQAWVHFKIDHEDNGAVKIIDGIPQKFVYFTSEIGEDTGLTFEYGIDLKTIKREINSDNLATKILVLPNSNEFAENGFCTIARSSQNYTRENFILNFDYYIQQGLLDKNMLYNDLYGINNDSIGYYYYLQQYNAKYDEYAELMTKKQMELLKVYTSKVTYETYIKAATSEKTDVQIGLIALAGLTDWDSTEMQSFLKEHKNDIEVASKMQTLGNLQNKIVEYTDLLNKTITSINTIESYLNDISLLQTEKLQAAKEKHQEFNNKYSQYIMEGTWQDENYIDDTRYYLDALNVAYTSSRPQLSYNINVLRLSALEEFSSKVFNLGDICYIQDVEFFGYLPDRLTPYKEKILINKISYFFDEPEKDVITVQNYKTKFDDLFQRIAAATQSLQFSQGSYKRAADSLNTDGSIKSNTLQKTLDQGSLLFNSSNQNVQWDDTGITIIDQFNSANQTKIIAGGLFITDDGGATWKNAISGNGISTNLLTAGRINADEIYIYNGSQPSFMWDKTGINAYGINNDQTNMKKFVRFDQYGLYGYDSENTDFVLPESKQPFDNEDTLFSIGWDGFKLRSKTTGVKINSSNSDTGIRYVNKFIIDQSQCAIIITSKYGNAAEKVRMRLGMLDNGSSFGLAFYDETGTKEFSFATLGTTTKNGSIPKGVSIGNMVVRNGDLQGSNWTYSGLNGIIVNDSDGIIIEEG